MSDRELLEKAAAAIDHELYINVVGAPQLHKDGKYICFWNPLEDSGDALELAVELGLTINPYARGVFVSRNEGEEVIREAWTDDKAADTRRCIVRAAAAIGEQP